MGGPPLPAVSQRLHQLELIPEGKIERNFQVDIEAGHRAQITFLLTDNGRVRKPSLAETEEIIASLYHAATRPHHEG